MCGIIGYVGNKKAAPILLEGLRLLAYRGYDSCGIATSTTDELHVKKDVGEVEKVDAKLDFSQMPGFLGIAHSRWASVGRVTKANAHPHLDCKKGIAVVHNGTITNYPKLKKMLERKGHVLISETDSEIIPHLIEDFMNSGRDLKSAAVNALKMIEGDYSILVIMKGFDGIIASRRGLPLVLGVASHGMFAASDIPAFLKHTKKVVYLQDNDFVVFKPSNFSVFNLFDMKKARRRVDSVDWRASEIGKKGFEHYMLKEIGEQLGVVKRLERSDPSEIKSFARFLKNADETFLVGCGTSYNACLAAKYVFLRVSDFRITPILASELVNYLRFITRKTVVVALSQSGETADVLDALKKVKGKCKTIGVVNVKGSSLTRQVDKTFLLNAGPELAVASTKVYTAQVCFLSMAAYSLENNYNEGKKNLNYLWNVIYYLTSRTMKNRIKELAFKIKNTSSIFLVGNDSLYPTALEAALKIKEVSYIHAEGLVGSELKHGPLALIEKGTPCIFFVEDESILAAIAEVKARKGYVIGVSPKNNSFFDFWIKVPNVENLNSIVQMIPMQLLAYELSVIRGFNPDKPRNLAKSVTVK
jgi:glucosamine--fructose-6-phosphate aminotransferase (isomerizing)